MRVLACPGQGSQSAGFLTPWLENPEFARHLSKLSAVAGIDLEHFGTLADEDTIRDTAIAQPLIVATGIAAARSRWHSLSDAFDGIVGHSVGEFTAAALAGVISDEDAVSLVKVRAEAMAAASAAIDTSMAALIGADEARASEISKNFDLEIANYNGAGQFVLAGRKEAVAALVATSPDGLRSIELKVAGAFHTEFMLPAVAQLEAAANAITSHKPELRIWSNRDGQELDDGGEVVRRLVTQVAAPVRFDRCLENLSSAEVFVELPPAGALSGLAKRSLTASTIALKTPMDFEKLETA